MKKLWLALLLGLVITPALAQEKEPIKIGDLGAYTNGALYALPYKQGVALAVREINASGGVMGRPLEIVSRDTKQDPGEAVRLTQELASRDKVNIIMNCDASNNTLGISNWTNQNNVLLIVNCSESDSVIWDQGKEMTFRVNPGGFMWTSASLQKAEEFYGDRLKNKRWVSIAPNFEFGQSIVEAAHKITTDKHWNVNWVGEQWPSYGKMNAGAVIQVLEHVKPDVIFAPLFDQDLAEFVREGKKRGFFKDRIIISPTLGLPEHLEMLGGELPDGWVAIGMPYQEVDTPSFKTFLSAYAAETKDPFRNYALNGYNGVKALSAAIERAQTTDPKILAKTLIGLSYETPVGLVTIRSIDHQATTPIWAGVTKVENGIGKLSDWTMYRAEDILPDNTWIKTQRKISKP